MKSNISNYSRSNEFFNKNIICEVHISTKLSSLVRFKSCIKLSESHLIINIKNVKNFNVCDLFKNIKVDKHFLNLSYLLIEDISLSKSYNSLILNLHKYNIDSIQNQLIIEILDIYKETLFSKLLVDKNSIVIIKNLLENLKADNSLIKLDDFINLIIKLNKNDITTYNEKYRSFIKEYFESNQKEYLKYEYEKAIFASTQFECNTKQNKQSINKDMILKGVNNKKESYLVNLNRILEISEDKLKNYIRIICFCINCELSNEQLINAFNKSRSYYDKNSPNNNNYNFKERIYSIKSEDSRKIKETKENSKIQNLINLDNILKTKKSKEIDNNNDNSNDGRNRSCEIPRTNLNLSKSKEIQGEVFKKEFDIQDLNKSFDIHKNSKIIKKNSLEINVKISTNTNSYPNSKDIEFENTPRFKNNAKIMNLKDSKIKKSNDDKNSSDSTSKDAEALNFIKGLMEYEKNIINEHSLYPVNSKTNILSNSGEALARKTITDLLVNLIGDIFSFELDDLKLLKLQNIFQIFKLLLFMKNVSLTKKNLNSFSSKLTYKCIGLG